MSEQKNCCCLFTLISSFILAAGIAAAFYAGIITTISVLVYITLIVGIISLIVVLFNLYCKKREFCFCINKCLIASIIGAIISSIFALAATELATASIPVAILIGAIAYFLITNLINITLYAFCIYCNKCNPCDKY